MNRNNLRHLLLTAVIVFTLIISSTGAVESSETQSNTLIMYPHPSCRATDRHGLSNTPEQNPSQPPSSNRKEFLHDLRIQNPIMSYAKLQIFITKKSKTE